MSRETFLNAGHNHPVLSGTRNNKPLRFNNRAQLVVYRPVSVTPKATRNIKYYTAFGADSRPRKSNTHSHWNIQDITTDRKAG